MLWPLLLHIKVQENHWKSEDLFFYSFATPFRKTSTHTKSFSLVVLSDIWSDCQERLNTFLGSYLDLTDQSSGQPHLNSLLDTFFAGICTRWLLYLNYSMKVQPLAPSESLSTYLQSSTAAVALAAIPGWQQRVFPWNFIFISHCLSRSTYCFLNPVRSFKFPFILHLHVCTCSPGFLAKAFRNYNRNKIKTK